MESVKGYYQRLAEKREPGILAERSRHWYALQAAESGKRVLDVGCGNGVVLQHLKDRYDQRWGVDLALNSHMRGLRREGIHIVAHDVATKGIAKSWGKFDLILCLDVLEHVFDPLDFMGKLKSALNPGGRLVLSTPNVRNLRQLWRIAVQGRGPATSGEGHCDGGHLHYFSTKDVLELTQAAGFSSAHAEGILSALPPGRAFKQLFIPLRNTWLVREFVAGSMLLVAVR